MRKGIIDRYQERYGDFGPTLAAEKLAKEGHEVNHETLRRWLIEEKLWKKKRRRSPHRSWLRLGAARGCRVDERLLPELLEYGRTQLSQRGAVLAVLGARGRWLAAEQPAWRWVLAGAPAPGAWDTGTRAERLGFFAALRRTDPQAARELVGRSYAQEPPEDRAELVARFAVGLSMADEPFLEASLDDRRKEVRLAAARVLVCLPASRLVERMAARARPLVDRRGHVVLPEAPDASGLRDGLETTPPRGEGPRAFYLRQILAAAPLAAWGPPAAALSSLAKSEWREVVILGWALATARQREAAWAEALLGVTLQVPELVRIVAPERREAVVLSVLGRAEPADIPLVLRQLEPPFGEAVSRGALAAVKRACLGADADSEAATISRARLQTARALLAEIAVDLAPSLLDGLAQSLFPPRKTPWHAALATMLVVIERRLAAHRSFKEPA